jgi:DNA topoisomerase-1
LEKNGIGRPSTFAMLVEKLQTRVYVKKENIQGKEIECKDFELEGEDLFEMEAKRTFGNEKGKLVIQPLGIMVMEFLEKHFSSLFRYEYTKQMEEELDDIAKGLKEGHEICKECNEEILRYMDHLRESQEKKIEIRIDENHTYLVGKHGPVIKSKETADNGKEVIVFKSVKKGIDFQRLQEGRYTIEEIVEDDDALKKGKVLSIQEGEEIVIKKGKYGLYMVWNNLTKNLKEFGNRPAESIRWEEVQPHWEVLRNQKQDPLSCAKGNSNIIREISNDITLRKGPKGNYLFFKTSTMKKPQFLSLHSFPGDYEKCSTEKIKQWIQETYSIF